ncbi:MAG: hypothetical protein JO345_02185 [Streptosporangiaceae bacterium]|nr:hypothetical protein [Streptosporangiaceae bacterium]
MSEDAVAEHCSHGSLEQQILDALAAVGAGPGHLDPNSSLRSMSFTPAAGWAPLPW